MKLFTNCLLASMTTFGLWGVLMNFGMGDLAAFVWAMVAAGFVAPQI